MDKEVELTLDQQRAIQKAATAQTVQGARVGVAVLSLNGQILSRGYSKPGWAFKWANTVIDHGLGVVAYLYNAEEYYGEFWRFGRDQGWEAF